ncbi:MAG: cadherin repeat domain-containing protein [Pseudomonadota bacterium]
MVDTLAFLYQVRNAGVPVTGLVFRLQASDPDGDPLEFSIAGGADADLFSIDPATGEICL